MRASGNLVARCLDILENEITPGISTKDIDDICFDYMDANKADPAPPIQGFPGNVCTSVNHVVAHGIPSKKKLLKKGDIINVDISLRFDGWYGDASRMFIVGGETSVKAQKLVDDTKKAMMIGIAELGPDKPIANVGKAISKFADPLRYGVVRTLTGHGIGRTLHTDPTVFHYDSGIMQHVRLKPGMFLTVEPMLNVGKHDIRQLKDGWTLVTKDKSLSAQWEHTIAITDDGYEILSL